LSWRAWPRRMLPYIVAATAGFLIAYLIVAFFVFPAGLIPQDLRMPNVVGMSLEDAQGTLGRAGFKGAIGEERYHASAPKGTVLQMTPPAGSREMEGSRVLLDVSRGQRTGEVPNLIGMTRDQALIAIENAGFDLGEVTSRQTDEPPGAVIESSPRYGEHVTVPASVNIVVSAGPVSISMPNLIGRTYAEARRTVESLGLEVGSVTVDSMSLQPPDRVSSQSPEAGRTVSSGTRVRLSVAGKAPIPEPTPPPPTPTATPPL
jgi:eukaryotic-like serine/threonine-protein kinase